MTTVPAGFYRARGVAGDHGLSKSGNEQVAVVFEITEGQYAGERVTWYGAFTPKAEARTVESLRYCGCTFPGVDITNLEGLGSSEVEVQVEENDWDGKITMRVAWVNQVGGVAIAKKLDSGQKASFRDRMKGLVAATTAAATATTAATTASPRTAPVSSLHPHASAPRSSPASTSEEPPF